MDERSPSDSPGPDSANLIRQLVGVPPERQERLHATEVAMLEALSDGERLLDQMRVLIKRGSPAHR